jgi:hypothetical protein
VRPRELTLGGAAGAASGDARTAAAPLERCRRLLFNRGACEALRLPLQAVVDSFLVFCDDPCYTSHAKAALDKGRSPLSEDCERAPDLISDQHKAQPPSTSRLRSAYMLSMISRSLWNNGSKRAERSP